MVNELNERCQCGFEVGQITNAGFRCFAGSPTAVTFRAEISESFRLPAFQLLGFLKAWISSGAVILVQAQMLSIDKTCIVTISSFNEEECNSISTVSSGMDATLIGSAVAGALILILLLAIITISMILWKWKKRANSTPV